MPSEWNIAYVLTKPMTYSFFNYYRDKVNIVARPLSLRRVLKFLINNNISVAEINVTRIAELDKLVSVL